MFGRATLDIPRDGDIGPSLYWGLSDEMALSFGRVAATVSDLPVEVTLDDGSVVHIGLDEHGRAELSELDAEDTA